MKKLCLLSKSLFSLILLLNIQVFINAQYESMNFEHFTLKDGLSQITINSMMQDSYGFIWIATQDGLNRYDGVENKVYRPDLENRETTIGGSFINSIYEDNNHNIWIATFSGLSKYDRDEDRFYNFHHHEDDTNSISNNLTFFVQGDSYDNIWVITAQAIDKLILPTSDKEKTKVIHYSVRQPQVAAIQFLSGWTKDKNGDIWISSARNGLFRISKKEQEKEVPVPENFTFQSQSDNTLPSNQILGITVDKNGDLWAYSDQVFTKVITDGDKVSFQNYKVKQDIPENINGLSLYIDDTGNAMIGIANQGLFVYNFDKEKLYNYKNETYNPRSLSDNNINGIFKDNSGVLWFGTANSINKYNPDKNKFKHFEPQPNNPNWLRDPLVFSLCVDKYGKYWVGINNGRGLYIYDPAENKFRLLTAKPGDKNALQDNSVFAIFKDSNEDLWLGTNNGLSKYNYSTGTFKTYQNIPGDEESLSNNIVRSITEDNKNNLWIGTSQGLNSFNKETGKIQRWQMEGANNLNNNIQCLLFDKQGRLWVGTFLRGLVKLEFTNDSKVEYTSYQADINDSTSLSSDQISGLLEDEEGNIWIATYGGGINKLDPKTNKIALYTTKDGLPGNNFYGLLKDNNANLWFSSSAGLTMYNTKNKKFINYDINDGLQSNEFNGASCYKDDNGYLYFGGVNGFNVFNPDDIVSNSIKPKIIFTDFKIQNKSVKPGKGSPLKKSIQTANEIELSYFQKDIRFEFAALHFVSPSQNQYAYMMEGYDDDWIEIGTQNYISFKSFPHGEYVLKVKASNCDGIWNEEGISIKVIINPPFWATWWFRLGLLFLVIIAIWAFVKNRERSLIYEKQKLEEIVDLRTTEIREKNEELKQQSEELKSQNEEITTQRDQLEVQHNAITDSILYARRIQRAVLPRTDYIDEVLPENFILFKPRNVVSGDFYWVKQINNYIVIAIADCTGHGVPGAIMSMLGISFINEIVQNKEVFQANHALNELRKQIKQALRQTGKKGEADDGMDMALCALDTQTNILQYAGANSPLLLIQNGEMIEIKPDKMPIGYYPNEKPSFTNHVIQLESNDTFYLFSDGFADQLGGDNALKYKLANLQRVLFENHKKPMLIQKEILEQELNNWMNGQEQTDDILLMGVRV
ncbi:MAG: two-component regulator propeller domain-containing protein [Bacteroidales bacterium]|nr:two-component regulator propeller domain-containing protein [Bacteroidales bacterium]